VSPNSRKNDRRPVPARERGWLELRGQDGSAARLVPCAHPYTRVSRLAPVPDSPAARELSQQALGLIGLQTTCTAVAPDVVFTVRMYGTRPLYGPRLVRNFSSQELQT
jgi:hypothetical protein